VRHLLHFAVEEMMRIEDYLVVIRMLEKMPAYIICEIFEYRVRSRIQDRLLQGQIHRLRAFRQLDENDFIFIDSLPLPECKIDKHISVFLEQFV
jgi:hypothetical protein